MEKEIIIEGMMCNHCVSFVKENLSKLEYVEKVEVSLEDKCAKVFSKKEIKDEILKDLIEKLGYNVIEIKKN